MGTWLDDTSKKTLLLKKVGPRVKVLGVWKLTPLDGDVLLVPFAQPVEGGPCGIEFDSIEYVPEYVDYRDTKLGQPALTVLEYSRD